MPITRLNTDFRAGQRHVAALGRQTSGRGRGGKSWNLRWFPSVVPTRVHFSLPEKLYDNNGTQDAWKLGYNHFVKQARKGKGGSIECGPNCVVCAYTDPQAFGLTNVTPDTALSKSYRDLYVGVAGWIEEWFHLVKDKNEQGKEYTKRVMCEKRTCEMCRNHVPKVFGKQFYTQFSYPVWKAVFEPFQERVERFCRCGGRLAIFDYHCAKCGAMMVDFLNTCGQCGSDQVNINLDDGQATCEKCHSEWTIYESQDPELSEFVRSEAVCDKCGHKGPPIPNLNCAVKGEKCNGKPDPYNIFDVSMVLVKKDKRTEIESWKIAEPDSRLFSAEHQGRPGAAGEELQIAEKVAARNAEPLDLNELFTPQSAAEQAKYIGVADPWGGKAGGEDAKYRKQTTDYEDHGEQEQQ